MTVVTAAQGSESRLLVKKQSALGSVATGNFSRLRFNTHSFDPAIGAVESNEIRDDREVEEFRHGNKNGAGQIAAELCYGDHDILIESALFSAFVGNNIQIGKTRQYLSIEDGATDIGKYRMFWDMIGNKLEFSIQPNGMTLLTWDGVGLAVNAPAGSSSGGTPVAASTNKPFDSFTSALYDVDPETGSEVAIITGLKFSIDNKVSATFANGQQSGVSLSSESAMVSGQFTALYDSDTWLNRFLNETEFPLVQLLTDPGGNTMRFEMPRVKLADAKIPVVDKKNRIITAQFRALRGASLGTAFKITKS